MNAGVANGRHLKSPEAVREHADEVSSDRLDVPARAQALGCQLGIIQALDQGCDPPSLVRDGREDEFLWGFTGAVNRRRSAAMYSACRASSAGPPARR